MSEITNLSDFAATLEQNSLIVRDIFPINPHLGNKEIGWLQDNGRDISGKVADLLSIRLTGNSRLVGSDIFGAEIPNSCFYTLFKSSGFLVVEATKEPLLLHTYLVDNIDYNNRKRGGAVVHSGHIGKVTQPVTGAPVRVALFDSLLAKNKVLVSSGDFPLIATLVTNQILPVTSEGTPVVVE